MCAPPMGCRICGARTSAIGPLWGVVRATTFVDIDFAEEVYADIRDEDAQRSAAQMLYSWLLQTDP